jgi:hypothetical protein
MLTLTPPRLVLLLLLSLASVMPAHPAHAESLEGKVEKILVPYAKELAASATVVQAVKAANEKKKGKTISNAEWKRKAVTDPFVQSLLSNEAANELEKKRALFVSEIFVSSADGTKVAFLDKTSSWNHKGRPKHDLPMTGKVWIGKLELDESSGVNQIQVSVPVLEGGRPIGTITVAAAATKL